MRARRRGTASSSSAPAAIRSHLCTERVAPSPGRYNETLMRENELFESHLQRTNPHLLDDEEDAAGKGRKKPPKRSQQMLLTAEQKYDIAVQEMEEVREEILHAKQSSEQLMDTLRARMEECDVRIAEIKKDAYEFKRDIVVGAENMRTGKTMAEKVLYARSEIHHHT